jgi:hypothetical protein
MMTSTNPKTFDLAVAKHVHANRTKTSAELYAEQDRVEKMAALSQANHDRTNVLGDVDLSQIQWPSFISPTDPPGAPGAHASDYYGHHHSQEAAMLAHYIGQQFDLSKHELEVLKIAGFFYDIKRELPIQARDPLCGRRSAEYVNTFLRGQNSFFNRPETINDVCRLISNHDFWADRTPTDLLAQSLHDTEALESARFYPNKTLGLKIFREHKKRILTTWANQEANQRTWMRHRGWAS